MVVVQSRGTVSTNHSREGELFVCVCVCLVKKWPNAIGI